MNTLSILNVINSVELNIESLFDLVDVYGLSRAVEIQAKMALFFAIKESGDKYLIAEAPLAVNSLYEAHKTKFENQAKLAFAQEYK